MDAKQEIMAELRGQCENIVDNDDASNAIT